jgi:cytochrome oxidase assembly protein ShyY1
VTGRTAARWAGYIAFAIVFAIACGFLANWQFTRNADRERQLALIAANYDADPVPLAEAIPLGGAFDPADQWLPVVLVGEYLADEQLLARNRAHGGTSAFEVLVPFRTDDGRVFIVDRGWVPPGNDQPEPDEIPAPPAGQVTVVARLTPGEPLPRSGRTAPEGQVPTIRCIRAAGIGGSGPRDDAASDGVAVGRSRAASVVRDPVDPVRYHGLRLHLVHDPHRAPASPRGCR